MKTKALFVCIVIFFSSCDALKELSAFSKCQFRMDTLTQPELAGVRLDNKNSINDLTILDATKVTTAFLSGNMPLSFNLNVEAKNPNPTQAAINKLEWIAILDGVEMVSGVLNDRIVIAPNNGKTMIPVKISVDLKEVLSGKSKDALINLAMNLSDPNGKPSRVKLKVKPTLLLGSVPIDYPGYITLTQDFKAN